MHDETEAERGSSVGNKSAEIASPTDLEMADVDSGQDVSSQATSIGKAPENQWGSNIYAHGAHRDSSPDTPTRQYARHATLSRRRQANLSLDDTLLANYGKDDTFELPSFENAERLLLCYMENCHNSFPFLEKKAFTREFYHCTLVWRAWSRQRLTFTCLWALLR
jgi:hypothetical protein